MPTPIAGRWSYLIKIVVFAGLYYGVGKLGLSAGALPGNVTPVWPPTGLALAGLLVLGGRFWPGVALGALAINGFSAVPFGVACGMAAGNTLEAVVGAALVRRWVAPAIGRVRDVVWFAVLAAGGATLISATVGVLSLGAGGVLPAGAVWSTWRVWWVGDALGALVVAPLILAWVHSRPAGVRRRDATEALVLTGGVLAVAMVGFSSQGRAYVVFPLLAWAALRFRHAGAATATLVITAVAVVRTAGGLGPFATGSATDNLWALDLFLGVVALTGLILAAVVAERDRAMGESQRLGTDLAERVGELQVANAELEAFTYSVSHDLRAPLRSIDGFSRILLKQHGESLGPEGQHQLEVVRRNARAMGTLIDELLAFSRLQRQELRTQVVDVAAVVGEAIAANDAEQSGREIEILVGDLPPQAADRAMLAQVCVNLIGNALKFSRGRTPARIEIGAQQGPDDPTPVFFVRDNGVGFDMAYAEKAFGVFQRLHRQEDFEGTGVGLAIVQRIVIRHGGRVWAESAPGAGATISFTLQGAVS